MLASASDGQRWVVDHITDTRSFDLTTGKPEAGTGDPIPCECCGRDIEIHASVRLIDWRTRKAIGPTAVIGTQCCKKNAVHNWGISPNNKNYWKRARYTRS